MDRYSSPFAPTDRDAARLADELRAAAQDDTRRSARAMDSTRPPRTRLHLRLRHALTRRTPRVH